VASEIAERVPEPPESRPSRSWSAIRRFARQSEASDNALVLIARGIPCHMLVHDGEVLLLVAGADVERAEYELTEYAQENRPRKASGQPRLRAFLEGADGALIYCAALVVVGVADFRHAFGLDWFAAGAADATRIVAGEWWRAVTALGLHGGIDHIASNLAVGTLFALFLSQIVGSGLAWLATLLAGFAGNLVNAYVYGADHVSIGASTAVFGTLGLLTALAFLRQAPFAHRLIRGWLPIAAGTTLLSIFGSGDERTDISGHVWGFVAGAVLGLVLHVARDRLPQGRLAQRAYGAAALGIFAGAWAIAFL